MIFMGTSLLFCGDPIPCIPFPLGISEGEGEDLERGAAPLLDAPLERWGIKGGEVEKMEKKRAIELLIQEVDKIPYLKTLPSSNDEFRLWLKNVENIINTGLEPEDKNKYQEASQFLRYLRGVHEEDLIQQDYIDEIIRYEIALKSIIQKYEILWMEGKRDKGGEVEKMDKSKAIEFIKQALTEIPHLKELQYDNKDFKLWIDKVEQIISNALSRDDLKTFISTDLSIPVIDSFTSSTLRQNHYLKRLVAYGVNIEKIIQKYEIIGIEEKSTEIELPSPKAFIAHGGRSGVLEKLCEFIEALGLEPLVVELLPSKGMSVDDKVNNYIKDADCGIVLATRGGIVDTTSSKPKQHPRLNIIDEVERLRAKFPDKTILLLEKGVELPSNISGLTHETFARQSMDRAFTAIVRELREMGILKTEKPPYKEHSS